LPSLIPCRIDAGRCGGEIERDNKQQRERLVNRGEGAKGRDKESGIHGGSEAKRPTEREEGDMIKKQASVWR
jgi:hypothetical protein